MNKGTPFQCCEGPNLAELGQSNIASLEAAAENSLIGPLVVGESLDTPASWSCTLIWLGDGLVYLVMISS
jgi:hypothetical protein